MLRVSAILSIWYQSVPGMEMAERRSGGVPSFWQFMTLVQGSSSLCVNACRVGIEAIDHAVFF